MSAWAPLEKSGYAVWSGAATLISRPTGSGSVTGESLNVDRAIFSLTLSRADRRYDPDTEPPHFETPQYATACELMVSPNGSRSKAFNKMLKNMTRRRRRWAIVVGYNFMDSEKESHAAGYGLGTTCRG